MSEDILYGSTAKPRPNRVSSSRTSWASRVLSGPIVESNVAHTIDDHTVLTTLPPNDPGTLGWKLPDELGLNMCSVDSTTTCPSTTWCPSTTACPSTTDCRSVQTCVIGEGFAELKRHRLHTDTVRIWPLAVS
jgi:hypothetical protein